MGQTTEFGVLGPLEVREDGQPVEIGSRKQRMLLAALLVTPNRIVPTETLVSLLWDDHPPASVDVTLRSLVSRIRRSLGPGGRCLQARHGGYLLRIDPGLIDAVAFERLAARGRASLDQGRRAEALTLLRDALALWRGPALADIADRDVGRPTASRLEDARADATEDLVDAELAAHRPEQALHHLESQLAAHPLRERAWGQLMLGLYRLGRQADALAAYRRLRATLRDELGVEPNPHLRRLQGQILRQDPELDMSSEPPAQVTAPHNLPAALTPLVGRVDELAELDAQLSATRLLTLTGVGGAGKTRLALQLATDVRTRFADGAQLIELAPLTEDDRLAAEVAAALGVSSAGARSPTDLDDRLGQHLHDRRMLLVLDNCEHLVAAAARMVTAILKAGPNITVVATSREPLGVGGEVVWPVPPLSLPPPGAPDPDELDASEAVKLFCQRARAAQVGFGLTSENAAAVAQICRRLDGIPLALELAASRMRVLGAKQIADRLDDRFALLSAGDRTALPRHQTLHATMDWSYQLLAPDEQAALRALAVFPASFDLAAADAVIDTSGSPDLLFRLVDKSVVVARRRDDEIRYELLETVRSYAERLSGAGETNAARCRHREHFTALVAHQRALTANWDSASWNHTLATEQSNFRAAITSALAQHDIDGALLIVNGLWSYWVWAGWAEPLDWLDRALAANAGHDLVARCEATLALAALTTWWELGTPERSTQLFADARALAETADDDNCRARVRFFHAEFLSCRGRRQAAWNEYLDALRWAGRGLAGWCHHSLGWIAMADGDTGRARADFERAAGLGAHNELLVTHALAALAPLAASDGDDARARTLAEQAVCTAARFTLPGVLVMALVRASQTHLIRADNRAAHDALADLFELLHRHETRQFRAEAFEIAAILAEHAGNARHAARYFGASTSIRQARTEELGSNNALSPLVRASRTRVAATLGEAAYTAATAEGASVPIPSLVAEIRLATRKFSRENPLRRAVTTSGPGIISIKRAPRMV
jgi:predicted ATPase/DNA-binding SARP family transcriptional activator